MIGNSEKYKMYSFAHRWFLVTILNRERPDTEAFRVFGQVLPPTRR